MAKVADGLPEGYAPGDVFIQTFQEEGKPVEYYVNCDGVKICDLGRVSPTPEMLDSALATVNSLTEANADAQAEIERLRAEVKALAAEASKEKK